MKKIVYLFIFFVSNLSFSQLILEEINLPKIINETSGLEYHDNHLITFNDSGNDPVLFYLNLKGEIIKTRNIQNIKNNDWEDIAMDDEYLYVADMGNNYDTRKNLSIIKIPKNQNLDSFEVINFSYPEQKSFNYRKLSMFDAEGLISIDDYLLIFTKNRAKKTTDIYKLPKTPGTYNAIKIGSLDTESIITGADFDKNNNLLALTSTISFNEYYLLIIENFSIEKYDYNIKMHEIPVGKTQVEGIKIIDSSTYWLSSEHENKGNPKLYKIKI
jgi:hypothetical protein